MPSLEPGRYNTLFGLAGVALGLINTQNANAGDTPSANALGWALSGYLIGSLLEPGHKTTSTRRESAPFSTNERNPMRNRNKHRRANPKRSSDIYTDFHGVAPATRKQYKLDMPKRDLVLLGRLEEIVYAPQKPSTLAGKEFEHSFLDFGDPVRNAFYAMKGDAAKPLLASDGESLFIIRDKSPYRFSDRGIIG